MSVQKPTRMPTGIRQRHGRGCKAKSRCSCPWVAFVYSKRDGKKLRKQFPTRAAAVAWRNDATAAVRKRVMRAPTAITLAEAAQAWLDGAREGLIRTRSGHPYKPSAIRTYEQGLRRRVLPELGARKLSDISRHDLQDLTDELLAEGLNPSTIGVTLLPVRAIYRRALSRGEVAVNPTTGLEVPVVRGGRDRIAPPEECAKLLDALPDRDRPLWAVMMYAGLRRGEAMALRIGDIDLGRSRIDVRRGWDEKAGPVLPKNGKPRSVPIVGALRDHLDEHLLGLGWRDDPSGLVFGVSAVSPFPRSTVRRAAPRWRAAGLDPITPHECRHTFASLAIAANINAKAISEAMGHSSISITLDKYGHLFPGNEQEFAGRFDAFMERADTAARLAQIDETGANPGAHSD